MAIANAHCIYSHIMSIFGIFLFFSQIDFLVIRTMADVIVTIITTHWWMQPKIVDAERHAMEGHETAAGTDAAGDQSDKGALLAECRGGHGEGVSPGSDIEGGKRADSLELLPMQPKGASGSRR